MVTERRQGVRGSLQKKQHTAQGGPSSSEGEGAPEDWGGLGPLSSKKPMTSVLPRDETPSQQLLLLYHLLWPPHVISHMSGLPLREVDRQTGNVAVIPPLPLSRQPRSFPASTPTSRRLPSIQDHQPPV